MSSERQFQPWFRKLLTTGNKNASESVPENIQHLIFAMESNGYTLNPSGEWQFDKDIVSYKDETSALNSLLGMVNNREPSSLAAGDLAKEFRKPTVMNVIRKYREFGDKQAQRLSYVLDAVKAKITNPDAVEFVAQLADHGGRKSGEAIAVSIALYLYSSG